MTCNICGGIDFSPYRGRAGETCDGCGSKARHRVAMAVYQRHLPVSGARVLHLAPEACLHPMLAERFGAGYITSDPDPSRFAHAQCLALSFPDAFSVFPRGYFDVILHNHVLEHMPGHYRDHLNGFAKLLRPGGKMIFSVPGPYLDRTTEEGGEHFASDAERLRTFLQEDHFKMLGRDMVEFLNEMSGGKSIPDGMTDEMRASISVRKGKAPMFIWQRDEGAKKQER